MQFRRELIGQADVVLTTLDTLRYDVAESARQRGLTPNLARLLPEGKWQRRHSPGSFTYAAHHAFFAGFLPTPLGPGPHPRLFAARFPGSESTGEETFVFDQADIVSGFAAADYRTICVGGVGFFNKLSPLGSVLPGLFQESYWSPELGVTDPNSTENQIAVAIDAIDCVPDRQRVFLFVNVSALHQPNCIFADRASSDSTETQAAALAYVDRALHRLIDYMQQRGPTLWIVCSDHGTAYGEDGYQGHRLAHQVVWDVPYTECLLPPQVCESHAAEAVC